MYATYVCHNMIQVDRAPLSSDTQLSRFQIARKLGIHNSARQNWDEYACLMFFS
jgi:hypothetical protein